MKQIEIGTCVPGRWAEQWLPHIVKAGFECVSINFHMSLGGADLNELAARVRDILGDSGVKVASLGYYCNAISNLEQRETLAKCIDMASEFGAPMVSTFAGALEGQSVEDAIPEFGKVFRELARRAADRGIKIAIENCPMGGTWKHNTCNIGFCPKSWEMMFNEVPNENVGLEWEPAHQMLQLIDPVAQLRQWVGKVVHLHGKDATINWDAVRRQGILGGTEFAISRTPGFGDTNWRDIITILHMGGYEGNICIEGYHDPIYSGEWEMTGQLHALKYLKWCRGGDFAHNPW